MSDWIDEWTARYPVGCRVEVQVEALVAYPDRYRGGWGTRLTPPYTGAVIDRVPPWSTRELYLRLHLDGRKHPSSRLIPASCVRRLVEPGGPGG